MKRIELIATAILTLLAGGTYSSQAQNTTRIAQQAYIKASNTAAGGDFGSSVAISGDTPVVGALGEASNATGVNGNQSNNSALEAGAAYVFVRDGTNWTQEAWAVRGILQFTSARRAPHRPPPAHWRRG